MARTTRSADSPLTPIKWQKELFKWSLEANYFGRAGLISTSDKALIKLNKDLTQDAGKSVRCEIIKELEGTGIGDNGELMANAEAMTSHYFNLPVHERGHAVQSDGPMSDQYRNWDFPDKAVTALTQWKGRAMEYDIVAALAGLYNQATDISVVQELAPSTNRIWFGGETSAGAEANSGASYGTDALLSAATATDVLFGPTVLEHVVTLFLEAEPRPQPLVIDGEELFLCLIHPRQGINLRRNTRWKEAHQYADLRGKENWIWKQGYGVWSTGQAKILIASYGRIPTRTGAGGTTPSEGFTLNAGRTATSDAVATGKNVARALLLGAQAGMMAYGGKNEQLFNKRKEPADGGRKPKFGIDWIYGVSKVQFKTEADVAQDDFAVYCIDTCWV